MNMDTSGHTPDYTYLDRLNRQQREAVVYHDGPSLVIAGAGSGKTRVLTYKIVDLLAHGFEPWRIMALTFTNKAAREMKERIAAETGYNVASRIWMGTFHSIFLRILRQHAELLGYRKDFTIYDSSDSKALVKQIIRELSLDDKLYRPTTIASIISNAKNALVLPAQYAADPDYRNSDMQARRPMTAEIYETYCRRCRLAQAMDFDDILVNMNLLLRDHQQVADYYRDFFRYILVDEYQDTNFAQHLAITQLAGKRRNICVVGDDAQSIYSFRGANIDNILSLDKRLKGLKIFKLERNYRSTQTIINAAGSLIAKNKHQMQKKVFSEKEPGEPIEVIRTYSDLEEARTVAARIVESRHKYHDSCDEYAILYRTNAQSRPFEEELRRNNIGYRIHGGVSFYQRAEIKDAICYFRTVINPDDDQALLRIINVPARGIGKTTIGKLQQAAMAHDVSIWNVLTHIVQYKLPVHSGTMRKLSDFTSMMQSFITMAAEPQTDAYTLAETIYNRSRLLAVLAHDTTPEAISQQENLSELLAATKVYVDTASSRSDNDISMTGFLSEVSLATDQDNEEDDGSGKVTLMTVHAAKGLEFKHVYIVGMEEELFPSSMSNTSPREIEEERRLMYVAMTRAEQTCTISYASYRFRNGQTMATNPSRFLRDIDPEYLIFTQGGKTSAPRFAPPALQSQVRNSHRSFAKLKSGETTPKPAAKVATAPLSAPSGSMHSASELRTGIRIKHSKFGIGTIIKIEPDVPGQIITVHFADDGSTRRLMLKFAKFDILS